MNFAVVNLGCKVNRVESDDAAARLAARGTETAEADADLIVVNTCTVTGEAEKKTRKAVRRALRANDRARVLVTGCAAAVDAAFYEALDPRVRVVGKARLAEEIEAWCDSEGVSAAPPLLPVGPGFRTRVGVKVQDGCDNACTYCIVHVARGRATSRPADEVVAEAEIQGCQLIVAHHPVIWGKVGQITDETATGRKVLALIEQGIAAICAHTNLDAAEGGVNTALALRLGLRAGGGRHRRSGQTLRRGPGGAAGRRPDDCGPLCPSGQGDPGAVGHSCFGCRGSRPTGGSGRRRLRQYAAPGPGHGV